VLDSPLEFCPFRIAHKRGYFFIHSHNETPSAIAVIVVSIVRSICGTNRSFQFQTRSQLFSGTHNKALSVAAMRVSNQIVRPAESTADTQPQLPPALLRLSE
jgi:hypothetical protein